MSPALNSAKVRALRKKYPSVTQKDWDAIKRLWATIARIDRSNARIRKRLGLKPLTPKDKRRNLRRVSNRRAVSGTPG